MSCAARVGQYWTVGEIKARKIGPLFAVSGLWRGHRLGFPLMPEFLTRTWPHHGAIGVSRCIAVVIFALRDLRFDRALHFACPYVLFSVDLS